MAGLSLGEMREIIRTTLDLDSEDLPDVLLDSWCQEGYNLSIAGETNWTFFQVEQTLSTVASVQAYPITSINPSFPLEHVHSIRGQRWNLLPVSHRLAQSAFTTTSATTREPNYYSMWLGSLYFWPIPDQAYSLTVDGYRQPLDWIASGSSATPDAPVEFHRVVLTWALGRAYSQQDDLGSAQYYEQQFGNQIRALRGRFTRSGQSQPWVVNGGEIVAGPAGRLRFDWE